MVYRKDYRRGRNRRSFSRRKKSFLGNLSLNNTLILINVVVFVVLYPLWLFGFGDVITKYIALSPELFFQGFIWTLVTSMFMHGGFLHLFVNMVSMFFVGGFVERLVGRKRFLWYYFASGIVAGLFFVGLAYLGLLCLIHNKNKKKRCMEDQPDPALFNFLRNDTTNLSRKKCKLCFLLVPPSYNLK